MMQQVLSRTLGVGSKRNIGLSLMGWVTRILLELSALWMKRIFLPLVIGINAQDEKINTILINRPVYY